MTSTLEALLDAPSPLDATTRAEFEDDFQHQSTAFLSAARKRAKHGLTHSRLRSVYWRLFLQLLDGQDMGRWLEELRAHRREYDELLRRYNVRPATLVDRQGQQPADDASATANNSNTAILPNPLTNPVPLAPLSPPALPAASSHPAAADLKINNPLSTASSSPWQQYFHSTELSVTIKQDLDRTYAESGFYQNDGVQQLMLNVLLVWAKCNPQYEYRQGMNELLAPIVLTVFKDNRNANWQDGLLGELLDRRFAEYDVWALFNKLMTVMAPFFAKIDSHSNAKAYLRPRAQDTNDLLFPAAPSTPSSQSPILLKCHHIHHTLLAQHDPALYKHLNSQDVQPQLYGLRWYRLLFAREFHVVDVCTVWDVLFSQEDGRRRSGVGSGGGGGYLMADYFTVAMLFYVRGHLLQGDNTACLRRLLTFPPVEDMRALIDRALFFTAPQQSQRGPTSTSTSGGAAGVDLPSVQQEHIAIQKFIAEYGNELENSYLDDPLEQIKRSGHAKAALLAGGINKLRSKASGGQHKTMPAAGSSIAVVAPAPLQHSQSASSLSQAPHSSSTSPSASFAASPTSNASLVSPRLAATATAGTGSVQSSAITVPFLAALQQDMGEKLHSVIHTLTAEYGRVHRTRTKLQSNEAGIDSRVELSGAKVEDEIRAQEKERAVREEKQPHDTLNISVELEDAHRLNGHSALPPAAISPQSTATTTPTSAHSAASFDLQLLSSSLADLKHIADVLLGRLTYTPQSVLTTPESEFDVDSVLRPQSAGSVRDAATNALSPTASHVFFAPAVVEDPKARLAQLLSEKEAREAKEQQQQHQIQHGALHMQHFSPSANHHHSSDHALPHSSAHSSHSQYHPALPFPSVKRNSLSVIPQSHSANLHSEPSSASPLSAPIRPTSSLPPPPLLPASTGPSLFDSTSGASGVASSNSSARALLTSLLGGEKRSVFED